MRRERTGCMLAKPYEARIVEKWDGIIVQPKINGVRCVATVHLNSKAPNGITLVSSTQKPINGFDRIEEELAELPDGVYDGELYKHEMPFQEISGIARTEHETEDKDKLEYWIFDIVNFSLYQLARLEQLFQSHRIFPSQSRLRFVHTKVYEDKVIDLFSLRDSAKRSGFEGIILRNPAGLYECKKSNNLLKMKAKFRDWFKIVGSVEENDQYGNPKNRLGALILADSADALPCCLTFKAGTGLTADDREVYWNQIDIKGWWALIEYPELTKSGIPHQPSIITISKERSSE